MLAGDFVRQVKQLMDLLDQVAAAARSAVRRCAGAWSLLLGR
jgi:hypothetical protein